MIQDCVATLLQAFRENGVEVRHPEPEIYYSERHHSNGNYDVKNSFKQWGSDYRQVSLSLPSSTNGFTPILNYLPPLSENWSATW